MVRTARHALLSLALIGAGAHAQSSTLPRQLERRLSFQVSEGTWMAADMSPDGGTILFDLLGDIYALDGKGRAARPLLVGPAFETQPVFSSDGRRIAFISDRSGAPNLWIANADGSGARQMSDDTGPALYTSPGWSADGARVHVSRTVHTILAFELFRYDVATGAKEQVTKARPGGQEKADDRINVLGAVASPDGRYLYYARKAGTLWSQKPLPHWEIVRRDLKDGTEDRIVSATPGAAMRPALSHDGSMLVYASRSGAQTRLRLRNLKTGADHWLPGTIDHDSQMGGYYNDLVPRVSFVPGDAALLTAVDGKLTRIDVTSGRRTPVPFTAPVDLAVGKNTRVAVPDETGPVQVRVIQAPRLSPDGRRIAFAALGTLYVQSLASGSRPVAVKGVDGMAYQPRWSSDGRSLVYVTWSALDGGHAWIVGASGGRPRRLTRDPDFYTEPTVSADGRTVALLRASHRERLQQPTDVSPNLPTDIVVLPVDGGPERIVARQSGARALSFDRTGTRLRYLGGNQLLSVALADGVVRKEAVVTVANGNRYFADMPVAPEDAQLSPDGTRLLVKAASELYLLDMPARVGDQPPRIDLSKSSTPAAKLTAIGADYLDWSADGRTILWSVGSTVRTIAAATARDTRAEVSALRLEAKVERPRDIPEGTVVLRGATAITMRGDEVIAGADVVVAANRIVAVGRTGTVAIPRGATIRDVSGRYIVPGFVDTHAHWFETRRQILDRDHWDFLANLAYGVTSGLEVQPFTNDIFGYQDMIDAGLMIGPRAFSTGPGVFMNSAIDSLDDARAVLTRYRDEYRTRNIKSYMVGNRTQRQWMVEASAELGMMPTTEGASDLNLNLTHAIDGFAGNEHNLPVSRLREDVVTLFARTRTAYTPTLDILYGGPTPLGTMIMASGADSDAKLQRFIPAGMIEARLRDRKWVPPFDRTWARFATDALRIKRAGGLVGIGSHGTIQGLGYHFEMALYAEGGATPMEVLRAATIDGAEILGRQALIGSLEPGKYADLLILDADPRVDIRNARAIAQVMKNGRIYDAETLAEVYPHKRPLPRQWFQGDGR